MDRNAFDAELIERLAGIIDRAGLTEIELQDGEQRLRLVRAAAVVASAPAPAPTQVVVNPAPAVAAVPAEEPPPPVGAVTSPMVGIVYLAPEPGAAPFVAVGDVVAAGQTVLLIEAMKTFNQIKAPQAGVVRQVLVAGGQPVEYGQPLMVVG